MSMVIRAIDGDIVLSDAEIRELGLEPVPDELDDNQDSIDLSEIGGRHGW